LFISFYTVFFLVHPFLWNSISCFLDFFHLVLVVFGDEWKRKNVYFNVRIKSLHKYLSLKIRIKQCRVYSL
jgi:hypothetical protein